MATLTFQNTTLSVINQHNQTFLTSSDLANALQYANGDRGIRNIYDRNADEFTTEMTALIEMPTAGGIQKVRIFSLRGAHLIAMFARTKVAKDFRKWVLDILDKEVAKQEQKTTVDDRTGLRNAVNMLVSKKGLIYSDAYNLVHQYMNVESIEDIPADKLQSAVEYVHRIILEGELITNAAPEPTVSIEFPVNEWRRLINVWTSFTRYEESVGLLLKAVTPFVHGHTISSAEFNHSRARLELIETSTTIKQIMAQLPETVKFHESRKQIAHKYDF